ncbi:hypothetical protein NDU88_004285 [Pleurodeles waltl]|uniref:Uncharacterized protein n=1 Tax=Pleurodeles waltl TaxID=8319 RepID=A0AAV7WXR9_PLEWA|nr:hypothetical protein NDU88_004285 [Pleurodeles waltl]
MVWAPSRSADRLRPCGGGTGRRGSRSGPLTASRLRFVWTTEAVNDKPHHFMDFEEAAVPLGLQKSCSAESAKTPGGTQRQGEPSTSTDQWKQPKRGKKIPKK